MDDVPGVLSGNFYECTRRNSFFCIKDVLKLDLNKQLSVLNNEIAAKTIAKFEIHPNESSTLKKLFCSLRTRWKQSHYQLDKFNKKNDVWLSSSIKILNNFSKKKPIDNAITSRMRGRPSADFAEASERTKRRKTEELRAAHTTEELAHATQMSLRASGSTAASTILTQVTTTSPTRAAKYLEAFKKSAAPKPYEISADRALHLIISGKMTKAAYYMMRQLANEHSGTSLFPSYHKIISAKKRCYPDLTEITITETSAEVKLQALLDHTSARLLDVVNDVVLTLREPAIELLLILKWGCDGSSGKQYKQKFSDTNSSDAHVFFTSVVPLQLVASNKNTGQAIIVWKNLKPSSPRFCRPVRLQFLKESKDSTCEEQRYIETQIASLVPFCTVVKDVNITVQYELAFTMVDGKIKNAITDTTSALRCYLCKATSKDFNNIDLVLQKIVDAANLRFGISSLHAWIRFMEWLMNISKKSDIGKGKWQARSEEQKAKVANRKREIQDKFKDSIGLHLDIPRPGAGTSNDGNTARRFFENVSLTAEILQIDENLIAKCKVILQTLSSGFAVDVEKFRLYCLDVAKKYVELYPSYPMPTSIHVILIHGYAIIDSAILPIGQLSEDAQEARNKDIRRYREDNSRKCSREKTMSDVFNRLLASSDPFISSLQPIKSNQTKPLPPEVLELLLPLDECEPSTSIAVDDSFQEPDDSDYDFY